MSDFWNGVKNLFKDNEVNQTFKRKYRASGESIAGEAVKGAANGIKKEKNSVVNETKNTASEIKNTVIKAAAENSRGVVKAFNSMLKKVDYQRKMDIISEDEYYRELEVLRDRYFVKGSEKWMQYTAQIYKYQKELLEKEKKRYEQTYNEIFEYVSDKIDAVINKQAQYEKKLQAYGYSFQKNTIRLDEGDIEFYSLADLKRANQQLEKYASLMLEAKKFIGQSGISETAVDALLKEISSFPIDSGTAITEMLLKDKNSELWLREYERKINLSKGESARYYEADMNKAVDESTEYMKNTLMEAGFEIPESFFDAGKNSAEKFGEGFSEKLNIEFEKIKEQIAGFASSVDINVSHTDNKSEKGGDKINNTNYYITAGLIQDVADTIKRHEAIKRLGGY